MSTTTDQGKPPGKSGQRSKKGERAKKTKSKASPAPVELQGPDQAPALQVEPEPVESPKLDPQPAVNEPIEAAIASPEPETIAAPSPAAPSPAEPSPAALSPAEPVLAEPAFAEPALAEPAPAKYAPAETVVAEIVAPETAPAKTAAAAPAPVELAPVNLQTIANAYRDYTRKSFEEFGSFVEQLTGARSIDKAMTVHSEFVKRAYETSVAESQRICELHNRLAKQTLQPFQGLVGKSPETRGKT
jgi:hypothetical protein